MVDLGPNYSKAKKEANRILIDNGIHDAPVMIEDIAKAEGLTVKYFKLPPPYDSEIAGYIDVGNKHIIINAEQRPVRQRFTIAHELGHWKLHKKRIEAKPEDSIEPRGNSYKGAKPTIEKEADAFAAELLVPLSTLRYYWEKGASSDQLARLFGVSMEVIGYRLDLL